MTEQNPTNPEPEKFVVNASELDYINEKLEKLNRKATKLGLAPMVLTVLRKYDEEVKNDDHSVSVVKKAEITLVGESPKIAGWTFVATVEPVEDSEEVRNMINKLPGVTVEVPVEYRTASMFRCDHCHTERQRNEIFVIQHENGDFKVVGRTCIKDFMGYHASPNGLVQMAKNWQSFVDEVREGLGGGGGGFERRVNLREFLFRAAYFVNMYGYRNTSEDDVYRFREGIQGRICKDNDPRGI